MAEPAPEPSQRPQNIYDDPAFLAGYSKLERFGAGWERAVEHDDVLGLLPDLSGIHALDLGCGAGQLAHYLASQGAEVLALDVSERMLALARERWAHPRVTYERLAIEDAAFPPGRFGLVVSSLAIHYVEDYAGLMRRISSWLRPGGVLVYSTEHPIYTARMEGDGWAVDGDGRRLGWGVSRYATEGVREENWFVSGVRKVHRTLGTLVNGLLDAGLTVERLLEPMPGPDWLQAHPGAADEIHRPMFLLIRGRKA